MRVCMAKYYSTYCKRDKTALQNRMIWLEEITWPVFKAQQKIIFFTFNSKIYVLLLSMSNNTGTFFTFSSNTQG